MTKSSEFEKQSCPKSIAVIFDIFTIKGPIIGPSIYGNYEIIVRSRLFFCLPGNKNRLEIKIRIFITQIRCLKNSKTLKNVKLKIKDIKKNWHTRKMLSDITYNILC